MVHGLRLPQGSLSRKFERSGKGQSHCVELEPKPWSYCSRADWMQHLLNNVLYIDSRINCARIQNERLYVWKCTFALRYIIIIYVYVYACRSQPSHKERPVATWTSS